MSVSRSSIASMFETIELPDADVVADLDDLGLLDAMALATVVETAAIDVRVAAIREIYRRGLGSIAGPRPNPPRLHAARPSSRCRRRKARKRRRRR